MKPSAALIWWRWMAFAVMAIAMLALIPMLISDNLARACKFNEWPYFPFCKSNTSSDEASRVAIYKAEISSNPGDITNYIMLSAALALQEDRLLEKTTQSPSNSGQPGAGRVASGVLMKPMGQKGAINEAVNPAAGMGLRSKVQDQVDRAAFLLAPQDLQLLRLRAKRALDEKAWQAATPILIGMVEHYKDQASAKALAMMLAQGLAVDAMVASLKPKTIWLNLVIAEIALSGLPVDAVIPLVLPAIDQKAISMYGLQEVVRLLRAHGQTLSAHALWLRTQPQPVKIVFNGDFDASLSNLGFGWEIPTIPAARSGVGFRLTRMRERGGVMELSFNGKPLQRSPLKQTLVLPEGRYRLSGDYMTDKLNAEKGLAWVLSCGVNNKTIGKTQQLMDTVRQWQSFSAEIDIPPVCGSIVELTLESHAAFEMQTGFKGVLYLDAVRIESAR